MSLTKSELDRQLGAVPLFAGLSSRQRGRLLDKSSVVEHQEGREIAAEGKGALAMHLVLSGSASVTIAGAPVRTLVQGDYFGEISLIDGKPRSASVTASEPLTTLAVPHLAVQGMLEDDATFARELLLVLCARLREAEANYHS